MVHALGFGVGVQRRVGPGFDVCWVHARQGFFKMEIDITRANTMAYNISILSALPIICYWCATFELWPLLPNVRVMPVIDGR